jgi:predicted nicotinamide N-methyase
VLPDSRLGWSTFAMTSVVDPLAPPPETDDFRRRRDHLLHRIWRRYQTVTAACEVGASRLTFTQIKDPDRVLDEVVEECDRIEKTTGVRLQDPLHLPYWAELWDSGAGVGAYLLEQEAGGMCLAGRSVLDLGCGMGLSGAVCAALGAQVLLADLEAAPLLFARLNSLPWGERVRVRRLDWQRDRLSERFDVIVGADILYERKQWEFLDAFWRTHLVEGGQIILGEPGRMTGDTFLEWAPQRGWALERTDRRVPTRETPVRVLRLLRL